GLRSAPSTGRASSCRSGTSPRPRARRESGAARSRPPGRPAPARGPRRAEASRLEGALDPGGQLCLADLALDPLTDEAAVAPDEVRLREAGDAVLRQHIARTVVHVRVGELEPAQELARVAREVLRVDPHDDHTVAAEVAPGRLESRRLVLARCAPRSPEVEHDDLAAERRERQLPGLVEAREVEVRGRGPPALCQLARDTLVLVDDLPDEQGEQAGDHGDG